MSGKPGNLGRFWQELKRRKVIYVITVYASATFVIIELVNNVVEPLNLPDRTPTIAIIVLAIGFPVAVIISWIFDLTPKGMERTKPLSEDQEAERPVTQNRWKIATYVSVAVIIGLIILNLFSGPTRFKAGDIQSLVVLPFDNFTGDDGLEYFVSGMHSSLIGDIQRISGLHVFSKTTSKVYKDMDMTLSQIAAELKVDALVEGTVMCIGDDSLCIQFTLFTPEEEQIWIADYKEEKSQILNLYNRVTKQIADEVKVKLTTQEENLLTESRTVDPDAHEAYMKGQYYLRKFTEVSLDSAMKYYELAKEIDPEYALAYTGICDVWAYRQQWGIVSPAEGNLKSMEAVMRAYALDSNNAVVQYTLAHRKTWGMYDWAGGEAGFIKSLSLNPGNAMTHAAYSHLLNIVGRPEEALEQIDIALKLDPMNPFIMTFNGVDLYMARKYDEAIKAFDDALSLEPGYPFALYNLWESYYMAGRTEEAYATLISIWSLEDAESLESLEQGYLKNGLRGALLFLADRLVEVWTDNQNQFTEWTDIAMLYSVSQETDKSIYWLEQAYKFRDPNLPYLLNPVYDNVRNDPRFQDLCRRMNLPY